MTLSVHCIRKTMTASLALLVGAFASTAWAQEVEAKKVFVDSPVTIPAAPQQANLLRFYSNANQTFYIDAKSLSIVEDGSLRYTLVGISQSGAQNISYEGLRCDTNEKRLFAFGRKDGAWSESRRKEWDPISSLGVNLHHHTLAWDYVCEGNGISGNIEKILWRLRYSESLRHRI